VADGLIYHAINRGNNRERVFFGAGDFRAFLKALAQTQLRYRLGSLPGNKMVRGAVKLGFSEMPVSPRVVELPTHQFHGGNRRVLSYERYPVFAADNPQWLSRQGLAP